MLALLRARVAERLDFDDLPASVFGELAGLLLQLDGRIRANDGPSLSAAGGSVPAMSDDEGIPEPLKRAMGWPVDSFVVTALQREPNRSEDQVLWLKGRVIGQARFLVGNPSTIRAVIRPLSAVTSVDVEFDGKGQEWLPPGASVKFATGDSFELEGSETAQQDGHGERVEKFIAAVVSAVATLPT